MNEQQYTELLKQGYSQEEIEQAMEEQENPLHDSYQQAMAVQNADPRQFSSNTFVSGITPNNIVEWQLELDSILERVEHLLRGDRPTFRNGSIIYEPPESENEIVLNNYGISEVMRILSLYINRNTILSNYDEDTIKWKVYDFGCDLADLFFLKYDEFGWNTMEKRKLYPILIRELIDVVHSAYLRALNGGERESIRKMISVNQNQNTQDGNMMGGMMQQQKQKKWYNPLTWGR